MENINLKKITIISLLLAVSIVFSILESFLPVFIPGVKIGFSNIVVLIILYTYGVKQAFNFVIIKIILVSFLLGTFMTYVFYFSLAGGLLSLSVMSIFKSLNIFSIVGVSLLGSIAHATGQIIAAIILVNEALLYTYYPYILSLAVPSGIVMGILAHKVLNNIYFKEIMDI